MSSHRPTKIWYQIVVPVNWLDHFFLAKGVDTYSIFTQTQQIRTPNGCAYSTCPCPQRLLVFFGICINIYWFTYVLSMDVYMNICTHICSWYIRTLNGHASSMIYMSIYAYVHMHFQWMYIYTYSHALLMIYTDTKPPKDGIIALWPSTNGSIPDF